MLNSPSHDALKKRCKGTPFLRNKQVISKKTQKNVPFSWLLRVNMLFLQNKYERNTPLTNTFQDD